MVTFKTKPTFSREEVIEAAEAVNSVVETFPGYLGRKLAVDKEGNLTDLVNWTDLASAEHAATEIIKSETCQKFFHTIDESTMVFKHLDLALSHGL
jgi:antibiotic biosynthesis monooxygenase (ABM) superfamily enzyme